MAWLICAPGLPRSSAARAGRSRRRTTGVVAGSPTQSPHHNEGTYVLELINGPGELVRELDRRMRVMDEVLRHLVVRVDDDLRKVQRVRERRQMRHQRRRVGRGSETDVKPTVDAEASEPAVEQAEVKG